MTIAVVAVALLLVVPNGLALHSPSASRIVAARVTVPVSTAPGPGVRTGPESGLGGRLPWLPPNLAPPSGSCSTLFGPAMTHCASPAVPVAPSVTPGNWKELGQGFALTSGASTYDAKDGYGLFFGGTAGDSTWSYQGGRWVNLTPAHGPSPPAEYYASMAYDSYDGYVVLFGGAGPGGISNQTWTFAGGSWTNHTSTAGSAPSPRYLAGFAYDSSDSELLLFGGYAAASSRGPTHVANDTWSFAAGRWTNLTSGLVASPATREGFAMTADSTLGSVVLFGGQRTAGTAIGPLLNDTWSFAAGAWVNLTGLVGTAPSPRQSPELANDPSDSGVVLFSGYVPGASVSALAADTWLFTGGRWNNSTATVGPSPTGRVESTEFTVSTATTNVTMLFSGIDPALGVLDDDGWSFAHGKWTFSNPPTTPSSRAGPGFTYDPVDGYNVLFGGSDLNDTWEFTGTAWTRLAPSPAPPGRFGAAMAYDTLDSYAVLFGGTTSFAAGGRLFSDTWVYSGGSWTNLSGSQNTTPAPRAYASMAYDSALKAIILYGGENFGGVFNDTWEFTGGHWSNITPFVGKPPSPRGGAGMTWDSGDSYLLLFGGYCAPTSPGGSTFCNDTWKFATGTWAKLAQSSPPTGRYWTAFSDAPPVDAVVMYGGYGVLYCQSSTSCASGTLNQTWVFSAGAWSNVTASSPSNPGALELGGITYDPVRGATVLFGGTVNGPPSSSQLAWWQYTKAPARPLVVGTPSAAPNPIGVGTLTHLSVTVAGGTTPYTYTWSNLPNGCTTANLDPLGCTPQSSGNYSVSVTVRDANATRVTSPSFTLVVQPAAAGSLSRVLIRPPSASVAPGDLLVLSAQGVDSSGLAVSASYLWAITTRTAASLSSTTSQNVTLVAGGLPGTVVVNVTATSGTLRAQSQATIVLAGTELAVTAFNASPASINLGTTTTLFVDYVGGEAPFHVSYSGLPPGCASSNSSSIPCQPTATGNYRLVATVVDGHGGTVHAVTHLTVNAPPSAPAKFPKYLTYALIAGIVILALAALYLLLTHPFRRRSRPPNPPARSGPTAGATLQAWDPGEDATSSGPRGGGPPPGPS